MTHQQPDPIQLYEGAVKGMRGIISGIQPDQLTQQTPCAEWKVQALMDHVLGTAGYIAGAISGQQSGSPDTSGGMLAAYDSAVAAVLKAASAPGALEKVVQGPAGEMPGAQLLGFQFMDILLHSWDLAKATGQDATLDPNLAAACGELLSPMIEMARQRGVFGPEVTVADDASAQDKLLGMAGRQP